MLNFADIAITIYWWSLVFVATLVDLLSINTFSFKSIMSFNCPKKSPQIHFPQPPINKASAAKF